MSIARPRSLRGMTASTGLLHPLNTEHMYSIITQHMRGLQAPLWDALGSPYASGRDAERRLGTCTLSCP